MELMPDLEKTIHREFYMRYGHNLDHMRIRNNVYFHDTQRVLHVGNNYDTGSGLLWQGRESIMWENVDIKSFKKGMKAVTESYDTLILKLGGAFAYSVPGSYFIYPYLQEMIRTTGYVVDDSVALGYLIFINTLLTVAYPLMSRADNINGLMRFDRTRDWHRINDVLREYKYSEDV